MKYWIHQWIKCSETEILFPSGNSKVYSNVMMQKTCWNVDNIQMLYAVQCQVYSSIGTSVQNARFFFFAGVICYFGRWILMGVFWILTFMPSDYLGIRDPSQVVLKPAMLHFGYKQFWHKTVFHWTVKSNVLWNGV